MVSASSFLRKPLFLSGALFLAFAGIFLASCNTSPRKAILHRWRMTDLKGHGHDEFTRDNQENHQEIEFTADGKVHTYTNGLLSHTGTYTLAPDGKSLLLTDPAMHDDMPMQILSLGPDKMEVKSPKIFGGEDTLVLEAH